MRRTFETELRPTAWRGRAERRGTVLVLALVVVLVVGMMATSFLQLNASATKRQAMAVDNKMAFYVAEAGLAESFASLVAGQTGAVGSEVAPALFGDGLVWVEPTPLDLQHVQLESFGYSGRGRAHLSIVAKQGYVDPAQFGIYTNQDLVIPAGTSIDGHDSSVDEAGGSGAFAGAPQQIGGGTSGGLLGGGTSGGTIGGEEEPTIFARIGSNGSVTVESSSSAPTVIVGDIEYGPEGTHTFVGRPDHEGEITQTEATLTFPTIVVPEVEQVLDVRHGDGTPYVVDPGVHGFGDVSVGADSQLVLTGPVTLVVDSLVMAAGSALVIDERGGPVDVYVQEQAHLMPNSEFSQVEGDSQGFSLQIAGAQTSTLAATGDLHGFVYSPNGTISLAPTMNCFGSLVADALTLAQGCVLSFDKALADAAARAGIPQMVSWRLVELDEIDAPGGMDVFASMGLDRSTMVALEDAVDDPHLLLGYWRRSDGTFVTYDGQFRAFPDWLDVEKVRGGRRDGVLFTQEQVTQMNERLRLMYERHVQAMADVLGTAATEIVNPRDLNIGG